MIENKDFQEALDRIARTEDGQILYRFLQKTLCAIPSAADDSALREHNGRRRFASELMGLMSKGIEDSERAITFAVAGPRAVGSTHRGAARRVSADTSVPGWDGPAVSDAGPAGAGPS